MKKEDFFEVLGNTRDTYILEALASSRPLSSRRLKWGILAACLLLALLSRPALFPPPGTPQEPADSRDGPPHLVLEDQVFYISSYLSVTDTLPEGFSPGGNTDVDGVGNCPYYLNPQIPEWVYVYQEVRTDGSVDEHRTLKSTEPHDAYVRYVDGRLRGKSLLCYNGNLYISMWHVNENMDADRKLCETTRKIFGIRIEGEPPENFTHTGTATFSGHDTIPREHLLSNYDASEVYADPDNPEILFVSTHWYTATAEENGQTRHDGFDVYILDSGPLK